MIRRLSAILAVLASGCGATAKPVVQPPRTVVAEAAAVDGVWLPLSGAFDHASPVGAAPSLAWVPIQSLRPEGETVAPGDELLRFDEETVRTWMEREGNDLRASRERRSMDLLRVAGEVAGLRAQISRIRAARAATAADHAQAQAVDPELVAIAELALANATDAHAAAVRRRDRLLALQAAGGAVTGSELQTAREEAARAEAGITAPRLELELARLTASAASIHRIELILADLDAQLLGLDAALRAAEGRQRARENHAGFNRRERRLAQNLAFLADPVLRSPAAGELTYRDESARVGGRIPNLVPCVFILSHEGLSARLRVPERLRPLLDAGPASRVVIAAPSLGTEIAAGHIASISSSPEDDPAGGRSFVATAMLDRVPVSVRPGMHVQARIAVATTGAPALIPGFCLNAGDRPSVRLGDGTLRELTGFAAGGLFVALSGLAAGERVLVPDSAPAPGSERVQATVEPAEYAPVVLKSWGWQPAELLPEGTRVVKGQRIARLNKNEFWSAPEEIRAQAEFNLAQARLDLLTNQALATADRARASTDWRRAELASRRAAIELSLLMTTFDTVAVAHAMANVEQARIGRERAEQDLSTAAAEVAAGGLSQSAATTRVATAEKARLELARAELNLAAVWESRDWQEQQSRLAAQAEAESGEERARLNWVIAGESYRTQLASATAGFIGTQRWVESELGSIANEEVFAVADGVLAYHPGWTPVKVGVDLSTMEPFRIATSSRMKAVLPIPARFYGRFTQGQQLVLGVPGLGSQAITGTVSSVAPAFLPRPGIIDELALGRTVGAEDCIFQVTVAFDPPSGGGLPPGGTVYVDL